MVENIEPIVNIHFSLRDIEALIEYSKLLKSNIIVYSKYTKEVIGFSQDFMDSNILKITDPIIKGELSDDFPNIVALSKNLISVRKKSISSGLQVYANMTTYEGDNNKIISISCDDENDICFNFTSYYDKYRKIMNEIKESKSTKTYTNVTSMNLINKALSAKAAQGIQMVNIENNIIYIPPTFIKNKKNEIVDIKMYQDKFNNYLIDVIVHRKNDDLHNIYRVLKMMN